ncbi:mechanosensitive ion channel family protein [Bacteriovoracaceae bacterium]|nr:mechanosensitive ion channel family protein [Bacteriovoracaceae bacterium]
MFASEFVFNPTLIMGVTLKVLVIFAVAITLNFIQKKIIPRAIISFSTNVRKESQNQLGTRTKTMAYVITKVVSAIIWIILFTMVLGVIEFDITPLLTTLGIASLGIGFAVQNVVLDYIQGFFILMEDWYRIGDWVTIAGMEGEVEDLSPRRTILREINGTMHVIPNSQIKFASNQTRDWARIDLNITVAYKEDINYVYKIINIVCQELKDDPELGSNLTTIPSAMRVSELGAHGIDICIRGLTKPGEQWELTGELRKRIKERFDLEGIEIPWPHTKVYFGNKPEILAN